MKQEHKVKLILSNAYESDKGTKLTRLYKFLGPEAQKEIISEIERLHKEGYLKEKYKKVKDVMIPTKLYMITDLGEAKLKELGYTQKLKLEKRAPTVQSAEVRISNDVYLNYSKKDKEKIERVYSQPKKPKMDPLEIYQKNVDIIHEKIQNEVRNICSKIDVPREMFSKALANLGIEDTDFTTGILYDKFDDNRDNYDVKFDYCVDDQFTSEERQVMVVLEDELFLKHMSHSIRVSEANDVKRYFSYFPNPKRINELQTTKVASEEEVVYNLRDEKLWKRKKSTA